MDADTLTNFAEHQTIRTYIPESQRQHNAALRSEFRTAIIGDAPVKIAIEAAIRLGWDRFIGLDGIFIGMHGFGASGPIEALYPHFGITAEATVKAAEARLHGG